MAEADDKVGVAASFPSWKPWWMESRGTLKRTFPIVAKLAALKDDVAAPGGGPLPPWTSADVERFARADPVHGPQLLEARKASQAAAVGSVIGGLAAAGYAYRMTKSPAGSALVLLVGVAASWAVSEEAASLAYGLNRGSPVDASLAFLHWWKKEQVDKGKQLDSA